MERNEVRDQVTLRTENMAAEAKLEIFADYFQIYLADPLVEDDWSDAWRAPSVSADRFIVRPRMLGFRMGRNSIFRSAWSLTKALLNYPLSSRGPIMLSRRVCRQRLDN